MSGWFVYDIDDIFVKVKIWFYIVEKIKYEIKCLLEVGVLLV